MCATWSGGGHGALSGSKAHRQEAKKTVLENSRIGAIVSEAFKEIVGINGSP